MRSTHALSLGASLAVVCFALPASAQNVSDYNTYKWMHFTQTAASPPSTPTLYYCNLGFDTEVANAFTTGTVTWTTTTSDSPATLTLSGTDSSTYWDYWWPGPEVATKAELDAMCPASATLTFAVSGGALGTVSGTLTIPADAYSTATPAFDTATFAALSHCEVQSALSLTTAAHPAATGTQFSATYVNVVDAVTSTTVASTSDTAGDGLAVTLQVAAGTLTPGHAYKASIDFTDRILTTNAGFGGATAFSAFEQSTELDFTTLLADGGVAPVDAGAVDAGEQADAEAPTDASVAPDATLQVDAGSTVIPSDDSGVTTVPSSDEDAGGPAAASPSNSGGGGICSAAAAVGAREASRSSTGLSLIGLALIGLARRRRGERRPVA